MDRLSVIHYDRFKKFRELKLSLKCFKDRIVFTYIRDDGTYEDHDTKLVKDEEEFITTPKGKYLKYRIFGEILNAYSGDRYDKVAEIVKEEIAKDEIVLSYSFSKPNVFKVKPKVEIGRGGELKA